MGLGEVKVTGQIEKLSQTAQKRGMRILRAGFAGGKRTSLWSASVPPKLLS